ncbi:MAG: hypothetical protein J0M12_03855, partial [Deltaproteobacteria bacterium]|nr:hypothetical protein [Deltaproteobacteria bacterium]
MTPRPPFQHPALLSALLVSILLAAIGISGTVWEGEDQANQEGTVEQTTVVAEITPIGSDIPPAKACCLCVQPTEDPIFPGVPNRSCDFEQTQADCEVFIIRNVGRSDVSYCNDPSTLEECSALFPPECRGRPQRLILNGHSHADFCPMVLNFAVQLCINAEGSCLNVNINGCQTFRNMQEARAAL